MSQKLYPLRIHTPQHTVPRTTRNWMDQRYQRDSVRNPKIHVEISQNWTSYPKVGRGRVFTKDNLRLWRRAYCGVFCAIDTLWAWLKTKYQDCGVGVGVGVEVGRSRLFFPESESESESTKFTDSDRLRASSYSRFTAIAMPIILAFFWHIFVVDWLDDR